MRSHSLGIAYCAGFITLEAVQSVYFGAALQRVDSFLVGCTVFGAAAAGCLVYVARTEPSQYRAALKFWSDMARASAATMISWLTYFIALQLLEPAVVYTVFSGTVPIVIAGAGWLSVKEASAPAGGGSLIGHLMIALSCAYLCIISLVGLSGFVRGGLIGSCGGLIALLTAGAASAWLVLSCRRLNRFGVKSNAQFGLRYLPYVGVAATAAVLGLDAKGPVQSSTLATAIALGLPLIVLPSYLVQRAVALVSPLTIGVAGALGPFLVFGLQAVQGRVAYSNWSLYGIIAYSLGAVITALSEGVMVQRPSRDPGARAIEH